MSAKISIMLVAIDEPDPRQGLRQVLRLEDGADERVRGEIVLAEGVADRSSRKGGSRRSWHGGCSASASNGSTITVEPFGDERRLHGAAGLDDGRGEPRLAVRVEGAGETAGVDQAVEAGDRHRFREAARRGPVRPAGQP